MNVATHSLKCSADPRYQRSHVRGNGPQTDPRSLAIQVLEAYPTFRGRLALGAIHIESDGDVLVLNGRLPSYYLKQLLQEILRGVDGVARVENHVLVINPSGFRAPC